MARFKSGTKFAIRFQPKPTLKQGVRASMPAMRRSEMQIYNEKNERLYINPSELDRFLAAADRKPAHIRKFAYTLALTGCRISEARELRYASVQIDERIVSVRTLKRRKNCVIREIPVPQDLIDVLGTQVPSEDDYIWSMKNRMIPRTTCYRWIKQIMQEAKITGPKATPKGLRHGFGVRAVLSGVQLHLLQKWMGHASMMTTAIYATVVGREERIILDRMWREALGEFKSGQATTSFTTAQLISKKEIGMSYNSRALNLLHQQELGLQAMLLELGQLRAKLQAVETL